MSTINVNVADQTFPQILSAPSSNTFIAPLNENIDEQPIPPPNNPQGPAFIAPPTEEVNQQIVNMINRPEYIVASDLTNQSIIEFKSPLRFRFIATGSDLSNLNVDILNGGAENPPLIPQQAPKQLVTPASYFGGPLDSGTLVPSKAVVVASLQSLLPDQTFKKRQLFFTENIFAAAVGTNAYPTPETAAQVAVDLNLGSVAVIANVSGNTFALVSPLPFLPFDGQIIELLTRENSQPIADVVLSAGDFFPETIPDAALVNSQVGRSFFVSQGTHPVSDDAQPHPNTPGQLTGHLQPEHDVDSDPQIYPNTPGTAAPHNEGTTQVANEPFIGGLPVNVFIY